MKRIHILGCFILTILFAFFAFSCTAPHSPPTESLQREEVEPPAEILSQGDDILPADPSSEEAQGTQEEPPHPTNDATDTPTEQAPEQNGPAETIAATPAYVYRAPLSDYIYYAAACAVANVNVRAGNGTSFRVLGSIARGGSLPYLWTEGEWLAVWTGERVGYVHKKYAYVTDTTLAIERVIAAGLKKLGTPYVWGAPRIIGDNGARNPYFTGESFDCSSFVQYCFYVGDGVKLGNYTGSQADHTVGKVLTRYDELKRGDFYFTGSGSISHVVIYMGNGYLLQTFSANGGPVSFTTDDRWRGKFISGRRVDFSVKNQYC